MSGPLAAADLRRSPNPLAADYARFRVGERLLLSGHSHQAWPDVALEGRSRRSTTPRDAVDEKWGRAFAKADELRAAVGALLGDPGAPGRPRREHARARPALPLGARPRRAPAARDTDGEFHTLRRQLARLGEAGLEVVRVPGRAGGHAGRAPGRRRRRAHRGGARLRRAVRDGADRARARRARGARARRAAPSCWSTSTTRVGPRRVALAGARAGATRGSSAAATSTCSTARATAGCASRRRRPTCGRRSPAGTRSSTRSPPSTAPATRCPTARRPARFAGSTYDPTSHYRAVARPALLRRARADAGAARGLLPPPGRGARPRPSTRSTCRPPCSPATAPSRCERVRPGSSRSSRRPRATSRRRSRRAAWPPTAAAATCGSAPPRTSRTPSCARPWRVWAAVAKEFVPKLQ